MPSSRADHRRSIFAESQLQHMRRWAGFVHGQSYIWPRWTDGIFEEYRDLIMKAVREDSVALHEYSAHLLSSQAFAFNLFLPFREGVKGNLSKLVSGLVQDDLAIDRVTFEWVPPGHLLCEIDGERPGPAEPATAADVVLWGRLSNGRSAAVLVEVKFTESGFTHCNGRTSRGNRRKDVCRSAGLFLQNPQACYLTRPLRKERDRRYWEIFSRDYGDLNKAFPNVDIGGECPFAHDMQQPMRNLAMANGLMQEDMAEKAWYVLCAHDRNADMAGHWTTWQHLLGDAAPSPFLPASEVIRTGEEEGLVDWGRYMRSRYQL